MNPKLHIHIISGDEVPIYRQIVRQVIAAIATEVLQPGDQLPSIRSLSKRLVVAPLTVKKAYDQLEAQGLILTRQGRGSFVANDKQAMRKLGDTHVERLRPLARRLLLEAELTAISEQNLHLLLKQERERIHRERDHHQNEAKQHTQHTKEDTP